MTLSDRSDFPVASLIAFAELAVLTGSTATVLTARAGGMRPSGEEREASMSV